MNKKGVTILELLISITIVSVVVLLLLKVIMSLDKVNNDDTYASKDEINRATIIKNVENDFLNEELVGLNINDNKEINLIYKEKEKRLIIGDKYLIYDGIKYELESKNSTYNKLPKITYLDLDDNYYLVNIVIEVLINNENTTPYDDIELSYIGLKKDNNNYDLIK